MRRLAVVASLVCAVVAARAQPPAADDPVPHDLAGFKAAAQRVLDETGVPGAGIALVTAGGVEWAGGLGWADRDRRLPVTADTHFRAGSISKTFVALALVQLYEDGKVDLDATVASVLPDLTIDNPWQTTAPVTIRHLLEHTAGFDDMHFNEVYVVDGGADLPLAEVLRRNPASRRVRWPPGTRMAYSNPGYAVAGLVVERVTGAAFDEVIRDKTFLPLGMTTSTFRTAPDDDPSLAQGYGDRGGPPVARRRIYLRPAGALQTSAAELGRFVQMLLNWGEVGDDYVVDPEYLSNMEWPRTTLASRVGVRAGYGLGIASQLTLPYEVLGHDGGIDGFLATYGYSPARDAGYVVLVNSTHAPEALRRLAGLALAYLKRNLAPPAPPTATASIEALRRTEGYYRNASPRNAILGAVEQLTDGTTVRLGGDHLELVPDFGRSSPLVPVGDGLFRRPSDLAASIAFTTAGNGAPVMVGASVYAERRPRWPVTALRAALALAALLALVAPVVGLVAWRRTRPAAAWHGLWLVWLLALAVMGAIGLALRGIDASALAAPTLQSMTIFAGSTAYPILALVGAALTAWRWRAGLAGAALAFAVATTAAHAALVAYLAWWGLLAFRSWTY